MRIPEEVKLIKKAKTITDGLIPLHDCTFIIPVRIESEDRLNNFKITYDYLRRNFETNIIVYECSKENTIYELINDDVTYIYDCPTDGIFHRTKYLNRMLSIVTTSVTVNYDVDVILPIESYLMAYKKISRNGFDLVYPFSNGKFQKKVNLNGREKLLNNSPLTEITPNDYSESMSEFGHCQFFKTKSYKENGWENEHFVSYGPEDRERYERFIKLGKKVIHLEKSYVYHIEHSRGEDSNEKNPMFKHNNDLYEKLHAMTKDQLANYYKEIDYTTSY